MITKNIEEELCRLEDFSEELEDLIEKNAPPKLHELLNHYMDEKKMSKTDVVHALNLDRNYTYKILNGTRTPTRNCIIQMSLLFGLDVEKTNFLLRLAEKSPLYVRNTVDAKVFYAIKHNMTYLEAIDFIWSGAVS
ncbi:MAG: helix-turn-helix transcriptional regulator [Ruminococcaceae bacterium]|nr:helix-turn-helix transcriptional regulator [Oscillospiraceae bacterium]